MVKLYSYIHAHYVDSYTIIFVATVNIESTDFGHALALVAEKEVIKAYKVFKKHVASYIARAIILAIIGHIAKMRSILSQHQLASYIVNACRS